MYNTVLKSVWPIAGVDSIGGRKLISNCPNDTWWNSWAGRVGEGYPRVHVPPPPPPPPPHPHPKVCHWKGDGGNIPFFITMAYGILFIMNPSFLDPILPYTYMYIVIGWKSFTEISRLVLHCNLYGPNIARKACSTLYYFCWHQHISSFVFDFWIVKMAFVIFINI